MRIAVLNYSEITFQHLNEGITSICREKSNHGYKYQSFEDAPKQRQGQTIKYSLLVWKQNHQI